MALSFRKIKRTINFGPDQGKELFYARAKMVGTTTLEELCELIGERSSMSSADVKGVLDSLNWVLRHELRSGRSVKVGELGNFRLSLSSDGSPEEKGVTAHKIRKVRVIFSPGAVLRETCEKVNFRPYGSGDK